MPEEKNEVKKSFNLEAISGRFQSSLMICASGDWCSTPNGKCLLAFSPCYKIFDSPSSNSIFPKPAISVVYIALSRLGTLYSISFSFSSGSKMTLTH